MTVVCNNSRLLWQNKYTGGEYGRRERSDHSEDSEDSEDRTDTTDDGGSTLGVSVGGEGDGQRPEEGKTKSAEGSAKKRRKRLLPLLSTHKRSSQTTDGTYRKAAAEKRRGEKNENEKRQSEGVDVGVGEGQKSRVMRGTDVVVGRSRNLQYVPSTHLPPRYLL